MTYPRPVRPALLLAAICVAAGGCGSGGDTAPAPASSAAASPASSPAATEPGATGTAGSAGPIDACSLVSAQDITALLGTSVEGKPTGTNPDLPGCLWENPANYESVSVEIGNPGTAVNGTLPPPEPGFPDPTTPGPDGMRFIGRGAVEFVAGGRSNTAQVAVLRMSGDEANSAVVDLARKIAPQIPTG